MWEAGAAEHGKIATTRTLIADYPQEIEADFHRYYGLDILDLYRSGGGISLRKVDVLVRHLPPESATVTAIRNTITPEIAEQQAQNSNPEQGPWSFMEMLLASLIDEIRNYKWMYLSAHSERDPGPPPEPMPRPGVKVKQRRKLTDEQRRMLDPRLRAVPNPPDDNPPEVTIG